MYYCYGQVRSQKGGIPTGGSDNSKAWGVFTAGEHPVEIIAGTYRSGDANEEYCLAIVPPSFPSLDGNTTIAGGTQGVIVLNGQLLGGLFTAIKPGNVYQDITTKSQTGSRWIIPPYHHVVVFPTGATSSSDLPVYLLGMDLIEPGSKAY